MSDYLEDNPHKVKNASYYRRQMKELERENAELNRIISESNKPKPSRIHSCDIEGCAVCDPTHGL